MGSDYNSPLTYQLHTLFGLSFILIFYACNTTNSPDNIFSGSTEPINWLIDPDEILDGGPGVDGIPSIDNPDFTIASEVNFLDSARRITGIRIGDNIRGYAHQILDHHEIVNDSFDGKTVAVTFCPLTGTSIALNRNISGIPAEFGVSGLLFRNNLIMYDRSSNSLWSQMQLRSIGGIHRGTDADVIQVIETNWATWRTMFPDSNVLNTNTGEDRNYNVFVYGADYTTNHNRILFPIKNEDSRLQRKDRVHAIIPANADENSGVIAYPIDSFGVQTTIIRDHFMRNDYLLVGNSRLDFANAFQLDSPFDKSLEFETLDDSSLPAVLKDQHGNYWDIFGYAISGPNEGEQLTEARSYTGYWYALADFFPNIELYSNE